MTTSAQWGPATRTLYIHKIYDLNYQKPQKQSSDDDLILMTISSCDNLIMTLSYHLVIGLDDANRLPGLYALKICFVNLSIL